MSYFLAYSGLLYIAGCFAGLQLSLHDLLVLFSIGLAAIPMKFIFGGFRFNRAGVMCILLFAALCCGGAAGALYDYSKTAAFAELGAAGETATVTGTVVYVSKNSLTVQLENGIGLTVVEREQNGAELMDRVCATGTLQPYANAQYRGASNQRFAYAARGVQGLLLTPGVQVEGHDGRLSLLVLGYRARSWISNRLRSVLDGWVFQLTEAMVTGQNNMDDELRNNLRLSGISHIAAASGLHVSIFLMLFVLVRRPLKKRPLLHMAVTGLIVFAYMVLIGERASVMRAGIMAIVAAAVTAGRRRSDSVTNLVVAGAAICIMNPYYAVDVGFQLSFAATLGIVLFSRQLRGSMAGVSAVVMLCLLPITTFYFNILSLETVLVNLLVVPLVPVIIVLGYATCLLPAAAYILRSVVSLVLLTASFFANRSALHLTVPSANALWIAAWLLLLVLAYRLLRRRSIGAVAVLLLITVTAGVVCGTVQKQHSYFYIMYNQGGSTVHIHTRDGKNILVDGDETSIDYAQKTGIRQFDAVLLTKVTRSSYNALQALYEAGVCSTAIVPQDSGISKSGLENMQLLYYNQKGSDMSVQGVQIACREEAGDLYVLLELDGVKAVLPIDVQLMGRAMPCDVLLLPEQCRNLEQASLLNRQAAIITPDYIEHKRIYSTPIDGGICVEIKNGVCVPKHYFRREFFR